MTCHFTGILYAFVHRDQTIRLIAVHAHMKESIMNRRQAMTGTAGVVASLVLSDHARSSLAKEELAETVCPLFLMPYTQYHYYGVVKSGTPPCVVPRLIISPTELALGCNPPGQCVSRAVREKSRDDEPHFHGNVDETGVNGIHLLKAEADKGVVINREGDYKIKVEKGKKGSGEKEITVRLMEVIITPRQTSGSDEFKKKPPHFFFLAHEIDDSILTITGKPFGKTAKSIKKPKEDGYYFMVQASEEDVIFTLVAKKP